MLNIEVRIWTSMAMKKILIRTYFTVHNSHTSIPQNHLTFSNKILDSVVSGEKFDHMVGWL